jgi:adenylate cyclase
MNTEDPKTEIEAPRAGGKTEIEVSKSGAPEQKPGAPRRTFRKIGGLLAGFAAVGTVLAGLTGYWTTYRTVTKEILAPAPPVSIAPRLSIVVLPFSNLAGDAAQDYLADGITDNLTTELSRIRNSFVIARNTAFTFKGKNIPVKEVSKELGVRYVLEGSVQRDQNRVRVNAQLIDGETGAHLWADRFEEGITDLFKLQDQVVARLANSLGYELTKAEAQKSTHSTNPDVMDLMMRGWAALWQPPTKERAETARDYFERAMKLDPQSAEAMVGFAYARLRSISYGWTMAGDISAEMQLEDLLAKAIAIDPGYAFAYYVKSGLLNLASSYDPSRWPEVIEAAQTMVTLDPNAAYGYFALGSMEGPSGRCQQGIAHVKQAFALSPRDPLTARWHYGLATNEAWCGQLDAAIAEVKQSINAGYRTVSTYAFLAGAEAEKGNEAEAKLALGEARRLIALGEARSLTPQLAIKWITNLFPPIPPIIVDGLRKVGLPEE